MRPSGCSVRKFRPRKTGHRKKMVEGNLFDGVLDENTSGCGRPRKIQDGGVGDLGLL